MEITNVRVRVLEKENSKMRGFASVTIDGMFAVQDIRILEGENGLFLAMPSALGIRVHATKFRITFCNIKSKLFKKLIYFVL